MCDMTAILNGHLITPFRVIKDGVILVKNGKILDVKPLREADIPSDVTVIDVGGAYVAPGFVDIHLHGGGEADTTDATVEAVEKIAALHSRGGTTSLVLSTVTAPLEETVKAIEAVAKVVGKTTSGAEVLGVHLEGPYISLSQKGAHNPRYIREPNYEEIEKILEYAKYIVRVTAAPEVRGALELGLRLRSLGILPCIGHSDATIYDVAKAIEAGYSHITHMYSCTSMTKIRGYKTPGVVEAALLFDELTIEIIEDGKHLPPELVRLILKVKGFDRVCAITDAIRAAGLPPGRYKVGETEVIVEDGVAWLPDRSVFAGSVAMMNLVLKNLVEDVGLTVQDAVRLIAINPAKIIGVNDRKGSLTIGKDADITVFNSDYEILLTMVKGHTVYRSERLCEN